MFRSRTSNLFLSFYLLLFFTGINCIYSQSFFGVLDNELFHSDELEIINGIKYVEDNKFMGHPFWKANVLLTGKVIFKGKKYEDLQLKYDLAQSDLIVFETLENKNRVFALNKNFVSGFSLNEPGLNYERVFKKMKIPLVRETCYYQVVYEGNLAGYIHHKKIVNNRVIDTYLGEYLYQPLIYIKLNDKFVTCTNRRTFLKLFPNEKKAIKKFIRTNRLNVDPDKPEDLARILNYIDTLSTRKI